MVESKQQVVGVPLLSFREGWAFPERRLVALLVRNARITADIEWTAILCGRLLLLVMALLIS